MNKKRVGGLQRIDPAVTEWQKDAATNKAALTKKQKRDRARVTLKVETDADFKARLEAIAKEIGTSQSQVANFILHWSLREWEGKTDCGMEFRDLMYQAKTPARTPKFDWNLALDGVGGE